MALVILTERLELVPLSDGLLAPIARGHATAVRRRLDADFRDAHVAVDLVGLSYREAALLLRVPEATITTRLYRARQRVAHSAPG